MRLWKYQIINYYKNMKINHLMCNKATFLVLTVAFSFTAFIACNSKDNTESTVDPTTIKVSGREDAELTAPPMVPKPIGARAAKKLIVNMEIIEKEGEMADGVKYVYWTFGGSVPGSFIRTRIG